VNKTSLAGLALIAALGHTVAAQADQICTATTLCLSDTITNTGSVASPSNLATSAGNPTNGPFSGAISLTVEGNQFGGSGELSVGADFSTTQTVQQAAGATGSDSGWNFYDDYFFTTTAATSNNATVISNFSMDSISSLQIRIFNANGNPAPTLGIPSGGVVDAWTAPLLGSNGSYSILLPTGFAAGNYDLQVRGEAIGTDASYGGTLQVNPVPLPAGLPLLLSGLGLLGGMVRRRRPA
jgi:hypothetical protein